MESNAAENITGSDGNSNTLTKCRPFVKWVGGKSQLLSTLALRIPSDIHRYYEPFVGGGALLFKLAPTRAHISDLNPELINAYLVIKNNVEDLISDLERHVYEQEYFYSIRNIDRTDAYREWTPLQRASRLIFLNKTCFNGLYRVNAKGHFNTPFGRYTNPTIVDRDNLRACSEALKNVAITLAGFDAIEPDITCADFVYFDPPYVPLSTTANFTSYHSEGFDLEMQKKLFEFCCRLNSRKIRFMLSNSSAPFVLDLYKEFKVELVDASRAINSKGKGRGKIKEALVTNF